MDLATDLRKIVTGEVSTENCDLELASEDTSIFKIKPVCIVSAKDEADLSALITYANEHVGEMSLTARSAGTDMSGGPLTSSVVVDFLKHFNTIVSVTEAEAVTEPGVFYRDFEKETLKHGAILPSYTASKELNTVGGMVANNSAGEKSLTYGKTERYVQSLNVMLSDGNRYTFSKLSRTQYEAKKSQTDFEGSIYRQVDDILLNNADTIEKNTPIVSKNSAGYGIWKVWDKVNDTFDLTQLFVGSQGTLGLITQISFKLVKPKVHSRMLVLFLRKRHMPELGKLINVVLKENPESFESYDDKTFGIMLRVFPKLMKRLEGNLFSLARDFWPETKLILTGGIPKLVMMAEFTGDNEAEVVETAMRAEAAINRLYDVATHVTRSQKEGEKFWLIRRESFKLLRENVSGKHTAPFIDDISVRPEYLPEFLPKLYAIMDEYNLVYTVAGHIGDGNFHIIPLMDFARPDFKHIIEELSARVYKLVGEYKGSITGEHNDGLIRTPFLHYMFSEEMLAVFSSIKNIFDPNKIFNPHKKVDPDLDLLFKSIKTEMKAGQDHC